MERDALTERVEVIEVKVDGLVESVAALKDSMDRRFDEAARAVDEALLEQRQYTEFVYTQLDAKMDAGFARVDEHLARLDGHLGRVDGHLARLDGHLGRVDGHLARLDGHLGRLDGHLGRVDGDLGRLDGHLGRLDRKLDRVIELITPRG